MTNVDQSHVAKYGRSDAVHTSQMMHGELVFVANIPRLCTTWFLVYTICGKGNYRGLYSIVQKETLDLDTFTG